MTGLSPEAARLLRFFQAYQRIGQEAVILDQLLSPAEQIQSSGQTGQRDTEEDRPLGNPRDLRMHRPTRA